MVHPSFFSVLRISISSICVLLQFFILEEPQKRPFDSGPELNSENWLRSATYILNPKASNVNKNKFEGILFRSKTSFPLGKGQKIQAKRDPV